jgi:transposase
MSNCKFKVALTDQQRERVLLLVIGGDEKAYRVLYAKILLAADQNGPGVPMGNIAGTVECHLNTVRRVCQRFVEEGLEAALGRKQREKPPTAPKLDDHGVGALLGAFYGQPPAGASRWTLHTLANWLVENRVVDSISYETVRRVLKGVGIERCSEESGRFL